MAVNGLNNIMRPANIVKTGIEKNGFMTESQESVSFADFFKAALDKANNLQIESAQIAEDFAAGKTDSIHQVMIAGEKADIALQFSMQIRNKILDAYSEIMRMQI